MYFIFHSYLLDLNETFIANILIACIYMLIHDIVHVNFNINIEYFCKNLSWFNRLHLFYSFFKRLRHSYKCMETNKAFCKALWKKMLFAAGKMLFTLFMLFGTGYPLMDIMYIHINVAFDKNNQGCH